MSLKSRPDTWNKLLYEIYRECRRMKGWKDLVELHKEFPEDIEYWDMLDETEGVV